MDRQRASSPEQLTEAHLPLVRTIARRYAGRGEELEDLVQLGAVGLVKASKRFDPNRGVAFASFAAPAIEGEIRRHLRDRASPLRIPRGLDRMNVALRRSDRELSATLGRSPTLSELATRLGVDETDVEMALRVEQARYAVSVSPEDRQAEQAAESDALIDSENRLLLARSIRTLEERDRRIVFLRFHADMTERQIAKELGISQAHVSRLLGGALEKLRHDLARTSDIASVIPPTNGPAEPKIPGMEGRPEETLTLAQYLELPYHVEVKGEQDKPGGRWKATVEELPGCRSEGDTPDEAVAGLRSAMQTWLRAALEDHREIRMPSGDASTSRSARGHSGRFLVRMPKSLHEQLAIAAEREHVSLNRFVIESLAASLASAQPAESGSEPDGKVGRLLSDRSVSDDSPEAGTAPAAVGGGRPSTVRLALATNLAVVVIAGLVAVALLIIALERGI